MQQSLPETIRREIRAEMARQRVTHRQIAEQLGISQQQTTQRLTGAIEFRPSELEKIAAFLGVPVTQFVGADVASAA